MSLSASAPFGFISEEMDCSMCCDGCADVIVVLYKHCNTTVTPFVTCHRGAALNVQCFDVSC
jgi:hypothetical protein